MSKAAEILEAGAGHMKDRAKTYDNPEGERSMEKCVAMFNALSGHKLTAEQGWHFMTCLKMVRCQQGGYRADNYEDGAAYFALAGEQAEKDKLPPAPEPYVSPGLQVPQFGDGLHWTPEEVAVFRKRLGVPMPEEPTPETHAEYVHKCEHEDCRRKYFTSDLEYADCPNCGRKSRGEWDG